MKILFISHAYPPTVGGVETQNFELSRWLSKIATVKTIANTRGRKFLPLFAPYATIKALILLPHYDVVLLGSGVVGVIGWIIKLLTKKPVIAVVHGLDINYNSSSLGVWYERILIGIYQSLWVRTFIPKLDKLFAVGNETIRVGDSLGIPKEKFVFIPNGVDTEKNLVESTRDDLAKIIGQPLDGKKVILTSGRLARRKGVAWFIRNVMPVLDDSVLYVIAGNGPDKNNITDAIKETGLEKRVLSLGYVTDDTRNILWNTCDIFVQPNIKITGDMEGFGISVIEAASCKIPVIASDLEGLKDAIKDGQNGFLVEHENAQAWAQIINKVLADNDMRKTFGEKARQYILDNYTWKRIAKIYLEEMERIMKEYPKSK